METLSNIMQNFGFPIAVVAACFWWIIRQDTNYRNDIKEMRQSHDAAMASVSSALNGNTQAIGKLTAWFQQMRMEDAAEKKDGVENA